jgi:Fur family transcriptional regulator, ferric uptake regulator
MQSNCIFLGSIVIVGVIGNMEPSGMLQEAGLRPTPARQQVLSSLLTVGRSLSHRELVDLLFELDRVTIFRSLKNLKKARLVHSVQGIDGTLRYVLNRPQKRGCPGGHLHFLCLRCCRMTCLTDQDMPVVRVPRGTEVRGKQFLVYGVCHTCSALKRSQRLRRRKMRNGTR